MYGDEADPAEVLMWSYALSSVGGVVLFFTSGEMVAVASFFTRQPEVLGWIALSEIVG